MIKKNHKNTLLDTSIICTHHLAVWMVEGPKTTSALVNCKDTNDYTNFLLEFIWPFTTKQYKNANIGNFV